MNKAFLFGTLGFAMAAAMLVTGYWAGNLKPALASSTMTESASGPETSSDVATLQNEAPGPVGSPLLQGGTDRAAVEQIVREYLVANPEIMLEVQDALELRQAEERRKTQLAAIKASHDEIFLSPFDGIVGNPSGKVTIVEFFDYNCGYCKRALADMRAMTEADPDLRFVLKEFPILGPESRKAHVVSMAVRALAPEKYGEFHIKLLGSPGRAGEASAVKVATSLGIDEGALREQMENPEIERIFSETYRLADSLSITGTPSYVVGDEVVFGALGQDVLADKVAAARGSQTQSVQ